MWIRCSILLMIPMLMLIPRELLAQSLIQVDQIRQGKLEATDKRLSDGSLYDWYMFQGQGGQRIKIELKSSSFAPYLVLLDRDGMELISGCAPPDKQVAHVEMTLPYSGRYHIRVNSLRKEEEGRYSLQIKPSL